MAEQSAKTRQKNFEEVNLGYSEETALLEASRCINCKNPTCISGCPVNVDIRAFIALIKEKKYLEAAQKIKETNALPAVCGRVCPQENQCEKMCVLAKKFKSVAIGNLERFVADYELKNSKNEITKTKESVPNKKVAIIGSGPCGLTAAADLAKAGFAVTIFEAFHAAGGVLIYGIPEFRLPKKIVAHEINNLKKLGVIIEINMVIGKILTVKELFKNGFSAVFICVGAGLPQFMHIPGEDLPGVFSSNEFLTRINLMKAYQFPKTDTPVKIGQKVAVIGGGNVAMDAARCAKRLGADVYLVYRRSEKEMPARIEEVRHAKEEGINFVFLTAPTKINGTEGKKVTSITCQKIELGPLDSSGRQRPIPIPGSEYDIEVDSVIMALGSYANPLLTKHTPGLKLNKYGYIAVKDATGGHTSLKNVWAGGDIVTGSATVIEAMGAGKKAAEAIINQLQTD